MYTEYLSWLKGVYPPDDPNFSLIYQGALPDTLVWRNRLGYAEMMTENYLRHPGYAEYLCRSSKKASDCIIFKCLGLKHRFDIFACMFRCMCV